MERREEKKKVDAGQSTQIPVAKLNATAENIAMLIIGRVLLGGGIGFGNQAVPLYLSEMAPARNRGAVNRLFFQFTTCFGILVANLINYFTDEIHPHGWKISMGLAAIPALLMLVRGIFCAETPNSLVEQRRFEEARKVLEKVKGTKNVDAEYQDLVEASEEAQAITSPFRTLLKRKYRQTPTCDRSLGIPTFQQLTGNNSILFYAPVIFQSIGFVSNAHCFHLLSPMELSSSPQSSQSLALDFGHGKELSKSVSYFLVIVIFLFVLAYGRSWGPLRWLVPRELFSLEIRSVVYNVLQCSSKTSGFQRGDKFPQVELALFSARGRR
ncbi:hypothetical protein AHAS_Ahas14G0197000 [Arachis hypogaea]